MSQKLTVPLEDPNSFSTFILIINILLTFSQIALCNEDANGNVPLGKSCNRYWQCQGGYPRLQRCPAMLVFDRRSLRCVVPPTEDCDIPTTQTPIDGDNPDGQQAPLVWILFFLVLLKRRDFNNFFVCVFFFFRMTSKYLRFMLRERLAEITRIKSL